MTRCATRPGPKGHRIAGQPVHRDTDASAVLPLPSGGLDTRGWFGVAAFALPGLLPRQTADLVGYAFFLSAGSVRVDGFPVRVVVREAAPWDACTVHVEDRVRQATQIVVGRSD